MLEIKPVCENCGKPLPYNSAEAMICTFECTFCKNCVEEVLFNVCPNCGGGFETRPVRPSDILKKYPAGAKEFLKPVNKEKFKVLLDKYKEVDPGKR
jgi:hypothetical protein